MNDQTTPPVSGILTVKNENGTEDKYHLPDVSSFSHTDGSNQVKFKAYPVNTQEGAVGSVVLNFDKMTGYSKSW